jgi:hypothetical protein
MSQGPVCILGYTDERLKKEMLLVVIFSYSNVQEFAQIPIFGCVESP